MSIVTTDSRRSFAGDGTTATFAFPLPFLAAGDLKVILRTADGSEALQALATDYTVAGTGNPAGGSISFSTPPPSGTTVVIVRDPAPLQPLVLMDGGPLPAQAVNGAFDRLTLFCQRLFDLAARGPRLRETDVWGAGKIDAGGNELVNSIAGTVPSSLATVGQVQGMALASGNVPAPVAGDVNRALVATGIGSFGWSTIAPAMLSAGAPAWTTSGTLTFQYTANAPTELRVASGASGNAVVARLALATATANAWVNSQLLDNNGAPSWLQLCGSAVASYGWAAPVHLWQNQAASLTWMQLSGGNLGLPAGGLTALTVNTGALVTGAQNGAALAGTRNRLVNGNFIVNQRGYVSGAALAASAYGFDRWKAGASGATATFTPAKPDVQITLTAGTLLQVIEDINVEGGAYVLSWAGTAQARVGTGGSAPSGAFAASPIALTGVAAGQAVTVEFNIGSLGQVQFEPGPLATPYERESFSAQLERCLRYYEKSFALATTPAQNAGTAGAHCCAQAVAASLATNLAPVSFKVRKRATPSITLFNPAVANAQVRNVTANLDFTVSTATLVGENGFGISATSAAATTAGQQAVVHWTADAEL